MKKHFRSASTPAAWEHFEHASDIGIRGIGQSCAQAFEQAAMALTAVIAEPEKIKCLSKSAFSCSAPRTDLLLVQWLNDLICEMSTRNMLFGRFRVVIEKNELTAEAWGEPVDPDRHRPAAEVKAATHAELKVRRIDQGLWIAQCVVDV